MIKSFVATGFSCLAIGSIIGYAISELTRQPQNLQAQNTQAAATDTPKPLSRRDELERRFIACIGRDLNLSRFSNSDLNNDLFECELQKRKSRNGT